jgi:hypothetical protein
MTILKKLALTLTVAAALPALAADINLRLVPGRGPGGFNGPDFGRQTECSARNRRGQTFSAFGMNPRIAQARALARCRQFSRFSCFEAGCRRF